MDDTRGDNDLTGGLDATTDEVTAVTPTAPDYREGVSMWIWDDAGRVCLPRIAVEAVGATWETARMVTGNIPLPDGRLLLVWDDAPATPVQDDAGRPRVLGAGPLRFECVEPFVRWRVAFDGKAMATTADDQMAGGIPSGPALAAASDVPVAFEIETRSVAPPWVQGSLGGEGFIAGEDRHEQLFTAEGVVRVDGAETTFAGGGLRIHRKGGSRTAPSDFFGHCWHSAFFPSGRAFGFIHYHPRPDGSRKFCEGWLLDDGRVVGAEVVDTPWLQRMQPSGDQFAFTLRTPAGDARIEGETYRSAAYPGRPITDGVTFPPLQQGIARYRWDGEEAFGMIERSAHFDKE